MRSLSQRRTPVRGIVLLAVLTAAGAVGAQVLDEANAGVQFNFTPPGARSLAMGGAFIGLADDATAAYANPAGLTILRNPEVSLEVRYTNYTHVFTDAGHGDGSATGYGLDTVDGVVFGETDNAIMSPSFLSYVYAGDGWALAAYRHQIVDFEADFRTQGAFAASLDDGTLGRLFPVSTELDLEVANYGFTFALDLTERFSIGVGASYFDFSIDGATNRYFFPTDSIEFFLPVSFAPSNLFSRQVQEGSDNDISLSVGLLLRPTDTIWIGAVYHDGPEFSFSYSGVCGPRDPATCAGGYGGADTFDSRGTFNLPTEYGLGIAYKPTDAFTVALDWNRVEYSALAESFTGIPGLAGSFDDFFADDADEFHLGFEYLILSIQSPVALRAGAWLDPAHQVTYGGDDPFLRTLWAPSAAADDEWHYTFGLGVTFSGKYQVDFAVDLSDRVDTMSLSGVYRF